MRQIDCLSVISAGSLLGLRILALAGEFPPYRGGVGTYAYCMAQAAAKLGAQVTVVAPDYGDPTLHQEAHDFRVIRFAGGEHVNNQLPAKYWLTRSVIRSGNYDLIHAMDWPFFIPVALAARRHQRRLFTVYGSDANDMARRNKRLAIAAARVFSDRSEIVTISAYTLRLLRSRFPGIAPLSLRYEHLGVGPFWYEQVERSEAMRKRLGLPPDKFILITVGRIVPRKGQIQVINALSLLPESTQRQIVYLMVGSDVDKAYAAKLDAAMRDVRFDARRLSGIDNETLRSLYANSDAFCLVGQDVGDGTVEGFGLVYLEAGAQKLPSIAGDIGAVGEVVTDGLNGVMVPTADSTALGAAISRLMIDNDLRKRLSEGARSRAAEFSWQRCAENTYRPPCKPS